MLTVAMTEPFSEPKYSELIRAAESCTDCTLYDGGCDQSAAQFRQCDKSNILSQWV